MHKYLPIGCFLTAVVLLSSGCAIEQSLTLRPDYAVTRSKASVNSRVEPFSYAAYTILSVAHFKISFPPNLELTERWRWAARYVVEKLGLVSDGVLPDSLRVKPTNHGPRVLIIYTFTGSQGNSIVGKRYLVEFYALLQQKDGSVPYWLHIRTGVQYRCRPGRGHFDWAKKRCN